MSTPRFELPTVPENSTNPATPVNNSLLRLDALIDTVVQDMSLTAPPTTVEADIGKVWIPAATATGAWAGHEDELALVIGADAWLFLLAPEGKKARNLDDEVDYIFGAGAWGVWGGGSGSGDVVGPASSVADRIVVFDGVSGKAIKDGGATISGLRAPNIQAVTSSATVTPTFSNDMVKITAQAVALALANPTGTAIPGLGMVIRIKDNGTARAISYDTQYRALGITLPITTVAGKTTYIAMIYNSDDTTWDCIATGTQA